VSRCLFNYAAPRHEYSRGSGGKVQPLLTSSLDGGELFLAHFKIIFIFMLRRHKCNIWNALQTLALSRMALTLKKESYLVASSIQTRRKVLWRIVLSTYIFKRWITVETLRFMSCPQFYIGRCKFWHRTGKKNLNMFKMRMSSAALESRKVVMYHMLRH
jgi:hypothetical protein